MSGRRQVSLLLVDPDPPSPDRIRQALASTFATVRLETVAQAEAARDRVDTTPPDCLIVGHRPPAFDGLSLIGSLRSAHPELPLVMYPTDGDERTASEAIAAGVSEYVPRRPDGGNRAELADRLAGLLDDRIATARRPSPRAEAFTRIVEAFPDVAFLVDRSGRYLEILTNQNESLLVAPGTDLVGSRFHDVIPAETADRFHDAVQRALDTGDRQELEYQLATQDGPRWFDARILPFSPTAAATPVAIWVARDITGRKRRQREYEQIFNNVHDGITIHDPSGDIQNANETFIRRLGYDSLAEITAAGISGLTDADAGYTAERARELIRSVAKSGEPETVEWAHRTKDGDRIWVEAAIAPATIGGADRVISLQRDITARKRRQQEYEQIFNAVNDAISVHDPETGDIVDANDSLCTLTGYDKAELQALGPTAISATDAGYTEAKAQAVIGDVVETGESQRLEWLIETKEGNRRWLEVNGTAATIGGDERYLSIGRDITERKRRRREYEQIFNGVNDAISVHDPETGEICDVNDAFLRVFGYQDLAAVKEQGIAGLTVTEEGYSADRARDIVTRVATTGESETVEWRAKRRDGDRLWLEVTATPAEIGGADRILAIQRDITERKRHEQRLAVFNRVLRHNLRNRIDVITSHAEALADRTDGPHADRILTTADALATLGDRARQIDQLFSQELTRERIDLATHLASLVDRLAPRDPEMQVRTDVPATATLYTDPDALTATLERVLENALSYGETVVTISVQDIDAGCTIAIADDGPGIPELEVASLDAAVETDLQHGRGLGLWQAKWGVERLNGTLTFDVDNGTTVRMRLPDLTRD